MKKIIIFLFILIFFLFGCGSKEITGIVVDKYKEPPTKNSSLKHITVISTSTNKIFKISKESVYYNVSKGDKIYIIYDPLMDSTRSGLIIDVNEFIIKENENGTNY